MSYLRRYEPKTVNDPSFLGNKVAVMEETTDGKYVRYIDVKSIFNLILEKVRGA